MNYLNLNEEKVLPVVQELNTLLADYQLYYQKLRNFHWNIVGRNFFDLHEKFEDLYNDARIKIDEIAERILTLRYHPMSNLSSYLENSNVSETKEMVDDQDMVSALLETHGILIKQMYRVVNQAEQIEDEGTIDLIGAYIRELEKSSWMLDAWLKTTADRQRQAVTA